MSQDAVWNPDAPLTVGGGLADLALYVFSCLGGVARNPSLLKSIAEELVILAEAQVSNDILGERIMCIHRSCSNRNMS